MNKKNFKISIDTWGAEIFVCAGTPREVAISTYHKKIDPNVRFSQENSPAVSGSALVEDSNKSLVVWFRSVKPGSRVITHESIHAAFHVLESSGVKVCKENQEALCYLADFIVGSIIRKLFK